MLVVLFMGKLLKYTWSSMEGYRDRDYDHPLAATTVIDLGMTNRGHSVSSIYKPT